MARKRKHLPRLLVYHGRVKKPKVSAFQKAQWQDPEYRARVTAAMREGAKRRKDGRREGLPHGMRRTEANILNNEAAESAKATMKALKEKGVIKDLDKQAEEALEVGVKIMRAPGDKKIKLAAARLVLEYTKSKPAAKSDITVNKAEEWLAAVTAENSDGNEGETSKDA